MERPRPPHNELTTRDNQEILGSLQPKGWAAFQEAMARAEFYDCAPAIQGLWRGARMTGAIDGEHRHDVRDAVQGARMPTLALGVGAVPAQQPNGADSKVPAL